MSPRLAHLCQWLEYNVCCVPCRWFMALRCVVTAEAGEDLIYLATPPHSLPTNMSVSQLQGWNILTFIGVHFFDATNQGSVL